MGFDIPHIHVPDNSPEAQAVEQVMHSQHVSAEDAVLSILRSAGSQVNPALQGLGLFGSPEDSTVLDAAVQLAYDERHRPSRRTAGP
jgi:hypothetical protein